MNVAYMTTHVANMITNVADVVTNAENMITHVALIWLPMWQSYDLTCSQGP